MKEYQLQALVQENMEKDKEVVELKGHLTPSCTCPSV